MSKIKLTSFKLPSTHEPELETVPMVVWKHVASLKVTHPEEWLKWHHASEGDVVILTIGDNPPIAVRKVTLL